MINFECHTKDCPEINSINTNGKMLLWKDMDSEWMINKNVHCMFKIEVQLIQTKVTSNYTLPELPLKIHLKYKSSLNHCICICNRTLL